MIEFTTRITKERVVSKIFCDRCKKEIIESFERQEIYYIQFVGGFTSVFGDGVEVHCDLCQHCLKELIGDFCYYS